MAYPSTVDFGATETDILNWIKQGYGFVAAPGLKTSGGTITVGLSVFNGSGTGKTFIVYSVKGSVGASNFAQVNLTTSDPALGTSVTPANSRPLTNGPASVATASYANTTLTPAGTLREQVVMAGNVTLEFLVNGDFIVLPPGNGVVLYIPTASGNNWTSVIKWLEI